MGFCRVCKQMIKNCCMKDHIQEHKDAVSKSCDQCQQKFRGNYELKQHVLTSHEDFRYSCKQCDKKYRSKSGLGMHIKMEHSPVNIIKPVTNSVELLQLSANLNVPVYLRYMRENI
ncbi:zinc finger protein 561-like [Hydractinia symbiolongicarpus]|uniref:zinc finger protein 561-like n=1 Tax=Hydractinia symbiolongicarpus TaxID=13093 RepID=UPI00254DE004|nr:zinc finger protein 561-like [Hydractinia symbiolongicarpus]XP_057298680.1 zinc finger protein 561-like [Hydractinia symbiolongicarpus]